MIRKLHRSDRAVYLQLVREFYSSDAVIAPIPDQNILATFKQMMKGSRYLSGYLFLMDGEAVGYGLIAKTFSQEAGGNVWWIDEIYIREAYRNQGLGREFLSFVEVNCPDTVKWLRLEVEPENARAASLYEKLGFSQIGYYPMIRKINQDK